MNLVERLRQFRPGGDDSEGKPGREGLAANQDVRGDTQVLVRPHCTSPVDKHCQNALQSNLVYLPRPPWTSSTMTTAPRLLTNATSFCMYSGWARVIPWKVKMGSMRRAAIFAPSTSRASIIARASSKYFALASGSFSR